MSLAGDKRDLRGIRARAGGQRNRRGSGSLQRVRPGIWKLTARTPPDATGRTQRVHRNISARNEREATEELARFVAEVRSAPVMAPADQQTRMDEAVERFLSEYLQDEKGREDKTIRDYRALHRKWFSREVGRRLVRDVDRAAMDRVFGAMRRAGLSRSRLNQARSLYAPFFRWARNRGLTRVDPMAGFDLPTSSYVSTERTPPEVDELCLFLAEALKVIPDVAPILVLGAVTGMRRAELVGLRRSHIRWRDLRITVNSATDGHRVKTTKTKRKFFIDQDTMAMLTRVCEQQDQLAIAAGTAVVLDPFVFSLTIDASEPMPADYVTKRVAILKDEPAWV